MKKTIAVILLSLIGLHSYEQEDPKKSKHIHEIETLTPRYYTQRKKHYKRK